MHDDTDRIAQILDALNDIKVAQAEAWTETKMRLAAVEEQVRKTNGSVTRHEQALTAIPLQLFQHTHPLEARIAILEQKAAQADSVAATNRSWWREIRGPLFTSVGFAITVLLLLMLLNSQGILAHWKP